ncbi:hypothetical protein Val02_81600 [Virgisporangium aliadipatigenens]|uniref:Ribosomally synthesized peptide with SipW-like signal peptide n=1 Tax=Virgisporangium aliadipatigenens TaxID=741659 RepID=A0A8J3YSY1_9ACTN|nr:hypothetical protein [Virgisporangium aliadipatigenens]GIJ51274.1 hypothetical protein Val02_81600 [Virgisporangium aliadipatigenens]
MRKITKRVAVIGAVSSLALGGGVAWAAWTVSGSGTGSAAAGSALELTATGNTGTTLLYPGATADLAFTVSNPNPFPVNVTSVTAGEAPVITVDSGHSGCAATNVEFVTGAALAGTVLVPAKTTSNGTASGSVTGALRMIPDAANACQGATFTVNFSLSGASAAS